MASPRKTFEVLVPKTIADLIPNFLASRRKEIGLLKRALDAGDLDRVNELGRRMKGVGASYGFGVITELGREIEAQAVLGDWAALFGLVARYKDFLVGIQITYTEPEGAPKKTPDRPKAKKVLRYPWAVGQFG